jgi:hypothetical protein
LFVAPFDRSLAEFRSNGVGVNELFGKARFGGQQRGNQKNGPEGLQGRILTRLSEKSGAHVQAVRCQKQANEQPDTAEQGHNFDGSASVRDSRAGPGVLAMAVIFRLHAKPQTSRHGEHSRVHARRL